MFKVPEKYRVKTGPMPSDSSYGNNGQFLIKSVKLKRPLFTQASDEVWEHVSVSLNDRSPTWDEMAFIKDLFWENDDLVIQIHPREINYVNYHPFCLHLWRKAGTNNYCETPDPILVGPL